MILKGLISHQPSDEKSNSISKGEWKQYRSKMFEIFAKGMIVESILQVEDAVKVVITQIIEDFLDIYYEHDLNLSSSAKNSLLIGKILNKLTEALRLSDDIEGSVIFVFNLIFKILNHPSYSYKLYFEFNLDPKVFFPFNFHKILRVRITFHRLLNTFLKGRLETCQQM